ncbi:hypothetical protein ACFQ4Q_01640 [Lysobacter gummosus]|uniref:hypothetical protein n=1 Tax=Lysobacter gummosus TaxID=262324 RepID=UPI00362AC33E
MIQQHRAQVLPIHRPHRQHLVRRFELGLGVSLAAAQQVGDVELQLQPQLGHRVAGGFEQGDAGVVGVVIRPTVLGP